MYHLVSCSSWEEDSEIKLGFLRAVFLMILWYLSYLQCVRVVSKFDHMLR